MRARRTFSSYIRMVGIITLSPEGRKNVNSASTIRRGGEGKFALFPNVRGPSISHKQRTSEIVTVLNVNIEM